MPKPFDLPWRLILGSNSPRRRELLAAMGLPFTVDTDTSFVECIPPGTPPHEVPVLMARGKSLGFHRPLEADELLITADTVVILSSGAGEVGGQGSGTVSTLGHVRGGTASVAQRWDEAEGGSSPNPCPPPLTEAPVAGEIFGKPKDREDALRMLRDLSGCTHEVVTAVCLRSSELEHCFTDSTHVHFAAMTEDEIAYYADTCRPFDKAGAYGIQEWIGHIAIEGIDGSYNNVVGFPTQKLWQALHSIHQ